jgi:hypothetical protein
MLLGFALREGMAALMVKTLEVQPLLSLLKEASLCVSVGRHTDLQGQGSQH